VSAVAILVLCWTSMLLAGMGLWQALVGAPRRFAQWASTVGYGYVLGAIMAGLLSACFSDSAHVVVHAAPWLGAIAMLTWGWAYRKRRLVVQSAPLPVRLVGMRLLLCVVLLILLLARAWLIADEAWLRPTFPWDAWSAWAVKPKTWFLIGHQVPFVSMSEWLAQSQTDSHTALTWNYPPLLGWIELWFASGAGAWQESLINLAWPSLWCALLLASYGQWRGLGLSATRACVATYALGSLPLLDAHVALAGYADFWLACAFGLAVLAWLQWQATGNRGLLVMALLLAACLPAIKLEGSVWLLCFSVTLVFGLLTRRWRWLLAGGALGLGVLGIALGGFVLPILGVGSVAIRWGEVDIPSLGALTLHWQGVGKAMLASLFTLPNWNLLWFVFPLVLGLRWNEFRRHQLLRLLGLLLLLSAGFLLVLFFFTDAGRWAENYTSANRLIMHITPVALSLVALLLRDLDLSPARVDKAPESARSPSPS
jgi:hypothetical protein